MSRDTGEGEKLLSSLRIEGGVGVVRVQESYATDPEDLWSAITDPDRLRRWWGSVEGDLRVGGTFRLSAEWDGTGRVDVCNPPTTLQVTIRESDESYREGNGVPPFDSTIRASVTAEEGMSTLVIEVKGMPPDKIAFDGVGWQVHAERLGTHVAGREVGDTEPRWQELLPAYQERAAALVG